MTDPTFDLERVLASEGPLPRETALAALDHAARLASQADFRDAARLYQRVIGFDDPAITAAAYVGFGEALYRLDQDDAALHAWEQASRLPENPSTYLAWRNVAAGRVRAQNLRGAFDAYREAERRAPDQDKPEIANRLGWLSKELGDTGAAGKYFARARGDTGLSFTVVIIAVTVIISLVAEFAGPAGDELKSLLALDKGAVAHGELWRLWTVTLVHGGVLHLLANMWALWIVGPFAEQLYGRWRFLVFYLVFALGGSLASFWSNPVPAVGASGAIFGMFGLLLAVERIHRPVVNRSARQFLSQIGPLILINLVFGAVVPGIDNMAHMGGLVSGLLIGFLFVPTKVQTLRSMWQRPGPTGALEPAFGREGTLLIRAVGIGLLLAVYLVLYLLGMARY
ncbi:MAG TPA: rhomboid family intramembrane serine protease [Candidatus Limnocylindrales bacterium]